MPRGLRIGQSSGTPYTWYPALDLSTIPFDVDEAAAPVTTRDVTVTTSSALQTEAATPGSRITIDANIGDTTVAPGGGSLTDIDVIIAAGRRCGRLAFNGNINRLRVRGPTVGTYSGGSIQGFGSGAGAVVHNDIILDGIGISYDYVGGLHPILPHDDVNRMAIHACRVRGGHCATYFTNVRHLIVTATSMTSGANPVDGSQVEVWSIRHDGEGPIVVVDSDIRSERTSGNSYHRVRSSPPVGTTNSKYFLVRGCTLLDLSNGLMAWANRIGVNNPGDRHHSVYFQNNTCYGQGADALDKMHPETTQNVAEVTGNTFYGIPSASSMSSSQSACEATTKTYSGNTHLTYTSPPAWGAAGDPTGLPLS